MMSYDSTIYVWVENYTTKTIYYDGTDSYQAWHPKGLNPHNILPQEKAPKGNPAFENTSYKTNRLDFKKGSYTFAVRYLPGYYNFDDSLNTRFFIINNKKCQSYFELHFWNGLAEISTIDLINNLGYSLAAIGFVGLAFQGGPTALIIFNSIIATAGGIESIKGWNMFFRENQNFYFGGRLGLVNLIPYYGQTLIDTKIVNRILIDNYIIQITTIHSPSMTNQYFYSDNIGIPAGDIDGGILLQIFNNPIEDEVNFNSSFKK